MATRKKSAITFIVPGESGTLDSATRGSAPPPVPAAGLTQDRLKQSVRIGTQRGGLDDVRVTAIPGEDIVVLHLAGGPTLTLHPETARDLMLAQGKLKRGRGTTAREAAPDEVTVPAQLQWRGLEEGVPSRGPSSGTTRGPVRGVLGQVLLSALEVFTGPLQDTAADFAASAVVKRVDAQVNPGVYALAPETLPKLKGTSKPLPKLPAAPEGESLLVFVHGTFSESNGTFGKLWTEHPQRVRTLFQHYGDRVYALDHPTLGVSPITNALTLAQALPKGARVHLVTHSRGGLVAEVLAQVCGRPIVRDAELELFAGADYAKQRNDLKTLSALVKRQGITVERIVRVACPARGTLLASKRLDAYLSVFKWTLELAQIPVVPELLEFLAAVAQRRADPVLIPGLAAQIPDSPLVQWLHAIDEELQGELRVVAGDLEGDSVTSWLKTLLADAFYWTDNDLVVQTRSMYGGAPRAAGASFVLDQGAKVSHFSYFSNERTAQAIVAALTENAPQGFRVIGPLSWSGESATGFRGARGPDDGKPPAEHPAVFILPGILGSNLKIGDKRIWLGWRLINGLKRLAYTGKPDGVEPDGPIGLIYDDLATYLSKTHEVIEFAYDWRRPIEEEAQRLAAAIDVALDSRDATGQPVRIIAHSMGGLVARTMLLERPAVWQRMMSRPGARMLMLGTPNAGSWAPMQCLSGDDTFGNVLVNFGAPFQDHKARELMARFPGFIQLQAALLDDELGLARAERWQALSDLDVKYVSENRWWHRADDQIDAFRWGVPPQAVLDRAVALRRRLDAQAATDFGSHKDKLLLVVGAARFTPDGYQMGEEGLVYLDAPDDGDGRVTLHSARQLGVRTWQLDCGHGSLPDAEDAFVGYLQLLASGTTQEPILKVLPGAAAREATAPQRVPNRPSRTRLSSRPPESKRDVLAKTQGEEKSGAAARDTALQITVFNGDLTFVRQPLVLGHYRSTRLTGTEGVVNRLTGGLMEKSLAAGAYPDAVGTHQVFANIGVNPQYPLQKMPRPEAVIVAGLGEEGKLRASDLVLTVRQAVIAWAQKVAERVSGPAHFELASTLVGSGGSGITVGQSAQLIAQAVRDANERLHAIGWPCVSALHLIEIYLDRATEGWRALQVQATSAPDRFTVAATVQPGTGGLRRPLDSGYRGADYDFIAAQTLARLGSADEIAYTLDTRRARTEVRAQSTQGPLLRELVASASNDRNRDPQIGRTLFQLLVPVEMEPFLGGTTDMVIEVDRGTAGIPWELLDTDQRGGGDSRPWAIRAKLIRKLRIEDFRPQVSDAGTDASILVIGEPACDPARYPRLPGARREAAAVVARLTARDALEAEQVRALIAPDDPERAGPEARTVVNALLERDWRIVHIAGHGEPPTASDPAGSFQPLPDPRGVVLSNGTFLGPREICSMRVVPELVFVNCCHLAARSPDQLLNPGSLGGRYDRARFAAGVAEELIKIGVRCVVAAGWAVDDGAAKVFAEKFYDALLRGDRYMDAVAVARDAARLEGGNTWAAYQCYGDPDWVFSRGEPDAQHKATPLADEFFGIASPQALILALQTLEVRSKFQGATRDLQRPKIRYLDARFAARWGGSGDVAEAFANAWTAARDTGQAVTWYERAVTANDASASIKASEQLGNLRARMAWEAVDAARAGYEKLLREDGRSGPGAGTTRDRRADREHAAAKLSLQRAARAARKPINDAIGLLEQLVALQPSMERLSLCGSAYKRLAMIEAVAGHPQAERAAIKRMKLHYERAAQVGQTAQLPEIYYPLLSCLAAEVVTNIGRRGWQGLDAAAVAAVRQSLSVKTNEDPDFWSVAGLIELDIYAALSRGEMAAARLEIESRYADLHARVSGVWLWASVYDQMRFVLPKYAERATAAEQRVVDDLLERLRSRASPAGEEA